MAGYSNIVISGPPSSDKSSLANALALDHSMEKFSVGDMLRKEHEAKHAGLPFEVWWRSLNMDYHRKVAFGTIPIFNNKEGIVGDSRYTSFLDKDKNLLVFLTASIDVRVSRAQGRPGYKEKSEAEIKSTLLQREEDEVAVGRVLFGKDYMDPNLYHLVLNSEFLSLKEEISAINGIFGRPAIYNAFTAPITLKS